MIEIPPMASAIMPNQSMTGEYVLLNSCAVGQSFIKNWKKPAVIQHNNKFSDKNKKAMPVILVRVAFCMIKSILMG